MIRRMLLLVIGFVIGSAVGVKANGPSVGLTMRDVVDILSEYSLLHDDRRSTQYYGYTDTMARSIVIMNVGDRVSKRGTVLHELIHVKARLDGIALTEEETLVLENQMYDEIFKGEQK